MGGLGSFDPTIPFEDNFVRTVTGDLVGMQANFAELVPIVSASEREQTYPADTRLLGWTFATSAYEVNFGGTAFRTLIDETDGYVFSIQRRSQVIFDLWQTVFSMERNANRPWFRVAPSGIDLGDLDDVDTSGAASGQVLEFDGGQWVPGTAAGAGTLSGLADTDVTGAASGDRLAWDGSTWVPSGGAYLHATSAIELAPLSSGVDGSHVVKVYHTGSGATEDTSLRVFGPPAAQAEFSFGHRLADGTEIEKWFFGLNSAANFFLFEQLTVNTLLLIASGVDERNGLITVDARGRVSVGANFGNNAAAAFEVAGAQGALVRGGLLFPRLTSGQVATALSGAPPDGLSLYDSSQDFFRWREAGAWVSYVPADGSRGFTSQVSGATPIAPNDLATKDYVDNLSGLSISGATTLSGLQDTAIDSPTEGQWLRWRTASGQWVNSGTTLDDLDDVNAPSPASGELLQFDGSEWTPSAAAGMGAKFVLSGELGAGGGLSLAVSGIPQTASLLVVYAITRLSGSLGATAQGTMLQFNGDSGANYLCHAAGGTVANAFNSSGDDGNNTNGINCATATANDTATATTRYSIVTAHVPFYAVSGFFDKVANGNFFGYGAADDASPGSQNRSGFFGGLWRSQDPITSVTISGLNAGLTSGTRLLVVGL